MSGDPALVRPTRIPKCTRCRNHGLVVPVRGHSGHCMWKLCNCPKCSLITERHKILEEHKLLRRPRTEEPPPTEDRTPDRTGNTAPRAAQAESPDLKRKKMSPTRISSFETVKRSPATVLTGPPMYPTEYLQTLDYFARETTRMYLGCPPIYHYPAFPIGGPASGFRNAFIPLSTRSTPASSVFPFRGLRPYYPLQDVRGDFRPSYYSPIPQYIPPGYLPSPHYMPSTVPMNVSFMAEPNTSLFGSVEKSLHGGPGQMEKEKKLERLRSEKTSPEGISGYIHTAPTLTVDCAANLRRICSNILMFNMQIRNGFHLSTFKSAMKKPKHHEKR